MSPKRSSRWSTRGSLGVLGAFLASAGAVGAPPAPVAPPTKDKLPTPVMGQPALSGPVRVETATGVFERATAEVRPIMGLPQTGIGLPANDPQVRREAGRPQRPPVGPSFTGPWRAPLSGGGEDKAADFEPRATTINQNFDGTPATEWTPPDPAIAAGYDYVLTANNDDFSVYDRCGNELFRRDINDFLGVSTAYQLFDPKAVFDPWTGRWFLMYHKKRNDTQESSFAIVVSSSSTPPGVGGWWWYDFNAVQDGGTSNASWADYFDLGYTAANLHASGNMFRFAGGYRWSRFITFQKSQMIVAGGASYSWYYNLTNPDGSTCTTPRVAQCQTDPGYEGGIYVNSREGGGDRVTVWRWDNALSGGGDSLSSSDLGTGSYAAPGSATQPGGWTLDTINSRMMPAVLTYDYVGSQGWGLFSGFNTDNGGGTTASRLIRVDPFNNTVQLDWQFWASGVSSWFPSVAADYANSAYWTFTRTSPSINAQMRVVDYNRGSFSNQSSLVRAGDGVYTGFRWGDYFAGQMDWADYAATSGQVTDPVKVWLYGEYATTNYWATHVCATSVYNQTFVNSVTPTTEFVMSGPVGGPFTPADYQYYTLFPNGGQTKTYYEVTNLPSWLYASTTYNDLSPTQTSGESPYLQLTGSAYSLGAGTYTADVRFTDCFNGGTTFTRRVTLQIGAPDVRVTAVNASNGVFNPGDPMTVGATFTNIGTIDTGTFYAEYFFSKDSVISADDVYLGFDFYALGVGASTSPTYTFAMPAVPPTGEGQYTLIVRSTATGDTNTSNDTGFDSTPFTWENRDCPADFNGDGFVTGDDFDLYVLYFVAGTLEADYNHDGFVTGDDFDLFVIDFIAGC